MLESFHCAAYSQILRRFWPKAFQDVKMRKLMINSILATDMGLHFKYMSDLGNLQEKLAHNNKTLDGWNMKILEEYRDLACGLLIKCADISNVVCFFCCLASMSANHNVQARKFDVAAQWATILTDEFSNQGNMEKELNMETQIFGGPPERDNMIKLGESQIGFMNMFAVPLFEGVSDILPAMHFSVDELAANRRTWEQRIEDEKRGCPDHHTAEEGMCTCQASRFDGMASPLTRSNIDLPSTNADALAPPTTPGPRDEAQPDQSRRGSADAAVTAFIVTEPASSPVDSHHRKGGSNFNPFNNQRMRSASPTKAKRKSRSLSRKGDAERPRTSPSHQNPASESSPPLPNSLMNARSQPDLYSQANGTVRSSSSEHESSPPLPTEKASYLAATTPVDGMGRGPPPAPTHDGSSSGAGSSSSPQQRRGKFFTKLWKRGWRSVAVAHALPPAPPPIDHHHRDGGARRAPQPLRPDPKAEELGLGSVVRSAGLAAES